MASPIGTIVETKVLGKQEKPLQPLYVADEEDWEMLQMSRTQLVLENGGSNTISSSDRFYRDPHVYYHNGYP